MVLATRDVFKISARLICFKPYRHRHRASERTFYGELLWSRISWVRSRVFFNFDVPDVPDDYHVVLPPLPGAIPALNICLLHSEGGARSYRIEDFLELLAGIGVLKGLVCFESYQIHHQ